jgi:hypothetical protein
MKINHCMLLALGGLAASFSVSAITLDTFDTFVAGQPANRGFDLTASSATTQTDVITGESISGAPSDTGFASMTRRATLTRNSNSGTATFDNNPGGAAQWSNGEGVISTATLRYTFPTQAFVSQNIVDIEFLLDSGPYSGVDLTISVYTGTGTPTGSTVGIQGFFPNAFSGGPSAVFSVASFASLNGGTYNGIWNSARQIVFTLTSTQEGVNASIDEINLNSAQVPEAKTTIPALGLSGLVGFVAWKRRKGN